jgi:hypothetical protein
LITGVLPGFIGAALALRAASLAVAHPIPNLPTVRRGVAAGLALAVAAVAGWSDNANYFGPGAAAHPWGAVAIAVEAARTYEKDYRFVIVGSNVANSFNHEGRRYLVPQADTSLLANPATLPPAVESTKGVAFVTDAGDQSYLNVLRELYPGGEIQPARTPSGDPFLYLLLVPQTEVASYQGLVAHPEQGECIASNPQRLGACGQSGPVRWNGSLFIPTGTSYAFALGGAAQDLTLDGATLPLESPVSLLSGWHTIEIRGVVTDDAPTGGISWRQSGQRPQQVRSIWLDQRPLTGSLRMTATGRASGTTQGTVNGWDRGIGFDSLAEHLGLQAPAVVTWEGTLVVPDTGPRRVRLIANGPATLALDGVQAAQDSDPDRHQMTVDSGAHQLRIQYNWPRDDGRITLVWQPLTGGDWEPVPPSALRQ